MEYLIEFVIQNINEVVLITLLFVILISYIAAASDSHHVFKKKFWKKSNWHWKTPNFKILNLIPGFATAVGILGTFFVLWYNLGVKEVELGDSNIKNLIKELANAFSTSLIGISVSLIFSFLLRIRQTKFEERSAREEWESEKPEKLLYDLLKVNQNFQQQLTTLTEDVLRAQQTFLKDLTEKAEKDRKESLALFTEKLEAQGQNQATLFSEVKDELGKLSLNIVSGVTSSMQSIMEALHKTLADLQASAVKTTQDEIIEVGRQSSEKLAEQLKSSNEAIKASGKTVETLIEAVENTAIEAKSGLQHMVDELKESMNSKLEELGLAYTTSLNEMISKHSDKLEQTFERIDEWQKTSKQALEQATDSFTKAVSQYQDFKDNQETVLQEVAKQHKAMENLVEDRANINQLLLTHHLQTQELQEQLLALANTSKKLGKLKRVLVSITNMRDENV